MYVEPAQELARKLMAEHGLVGWAFDWDRARKRFGACHVSKKKITLSWHLVQLNSEEKVRTTILHEIAHALAPKGSGHGRAWANVASDLGIVPERCYSIDDTETPQYRYIAECSCGVVHGFYRMPTRRFSCRQTGQCLEFKLVEK